MKCDVIVAGVGGQGILSVAGIIATSALEGGLEANQSEVHGMSQRGGAVVAHLRLADRPIHSCTIARGQADVIVGMEPLESLRYLAYLSPQGTLLAATEPVANIPDYPDLDDILAAIRALPRAYTIDSVSFAKRAGNAEAANMVMVGAALDWLPLAGPQIEKLIAEVFASRSEKLVRTNIDAFRAGQEAARGARAGAPTRAGASG